MASMGQRVSWMLALVVGVSCGNDLDIDEPVFGEIEPCYSDQQCVAVFEDLLYCIDPGPSGECVACRDDDDCSEPGDVCQRYAEIQLCDWPVCEGAFDCCPDDAWCAEVDPAEPFCVNPNGTGGDCYECTRDEHCASDETCHIATDGNYCLKL